jgi:ribulose-5-phosphate 4-epimerase/fuculose-1-phosphate aldolase
MDMKAKTPSIHIIGGGTVFHVRPHLAIAAPAYGRTALSLGNLLRMHVSRNGEEGDCYNVYTHLTKMAGGDKLETNADVERLINTLIADEDTKIVFMPVALCDFAGTIIEKGDSGEPITTPSGKDEPRLPSRGGPFLMELHPATKIIKKVREWRKDIYLVGFKTTAGATPDEQFRAGLHLLKSTSCNLVLANDVHTRLNMTITPEQAYYGKTFDRSEALATLVEIAMSRARGNFTRSTVLSGDPLPWDHRIVPPTLREVVNHCIKEGAYKPFLGSTVGHFAFKETDTTFFTSRRKTNFNELDKVGLVMCESEGPNHVVAYGSKPSVGGQSQRIIFKRHPEMDCIVHFHCPPRHGVEHVETPDGASDVFANHGEITVRPQWKHECGSHECGENTAQGLKEHTDGKGNKLLAVYLDHHGPNIVFNRNVDPAFVIDFIDKNFDLKRSTAEVE